MLEESKAQPYLWAEAVNTAAFVIDAQLNCTQM